MKHALLLCLAALAAGASALSAPGGFRVSAAAWEGCEMLKPKTCEVHSDTCALCTAPNGKRLCFEPKIAAFLPADTFTCEGATVDGAGEAANAPDNKKKPWLGCEALKPAACEAAADTCALCTSHTGKRLCFDPKIAAILPPSSFSCTGTKDAGGDAPGADELETPGEEPKPSPKPWAKCKGLAGTNCTDAPECVLCTTPKGKEACLNEKVAQMLPPAIFKCTKDAGDDAPAAATLAVAVGKKRPAPWKGCETQPGDATCAADPACSLCTTLSGTTLCFDTKISRFLPSDVFKCASGEAVALAAAADGDDDAPPAPWTPCETYDAAECASAADACATCTTPDGDAFCFRRTAVPTLSPAVFECEPAPEAALAAAAGKGKGKGKGKGPKPWAGCERLKGKNCTRAPGCELCATASGEATCFSEKVAKKLPSFVFKCTKGEEGALAAAAGKKEPKPWWSGCEMLKGPACAADPKCALCATPKGKTMCFEADTAQSLPPFVFNCTAPAAPAGPIFSRFSRFGVVPAQKKGVDKPAPTPPKPWTPCEAFSAIECAAAGAECAACALRDGSDMCFSLPVAARLPPSAFKCELPDESA